MKTSFLRMNAPNNSNGRRICFIFGEYKLTIRIRPHYVHLADNAVPLITSIYNRGYWLFELCSSSGILKNSAFRKLDVFYHQVRGWETSTKLRWLQRLRLSTSNRPNINSLTLSSKDGNRSSFRNVMFFIISSNAQSPKKTYLSRVIHR
jgi:hypothetical protein